MEKINWRGQDQNYRRIRNYIATHTGAGFTVAMVRYWMADHFSDVPSDSTIRTFLSRMSREGVLRTYSNASVYVVNKK